ncbi:hypothetical protein C0993_007082 [Termitomyces sp. T159_Od127]|nr:hypothetical protein C0993_007082 [Termitomyces sp. T159_Od127]
MHDSVKRKSPPDDMPHPAPLLPDWPPPPHAASPLSAEVVFKRPRLDKIQTGLRRRPPLPRKSPLKPRPPPTPRHGSDIEDLGIVSAADPGPSSGSLLRLRPAPNTVDPSSPSVVPFFPIDTSSVHIPSPHPLVNRQTLKELDLDVILRNPQLQFLEVLLLVIQPLSNVSGMYVNPSTLKSQIQEHSAQAAYVRSIFDPALIEQELKHELFDPSGLFSAIGAILKGHCAPMRDRAVEAMVQVAQSCAPGGTGGKRDAVIAVRMCLEILELMKLDIANHQLQMLRPFLMRTSGQFELKAFKTRKECSLKLTREWLRLAHADLLSRENIPHPKYPSNSIQYNTLPRNQPTYLAVLKGMIDLIFDPPELSSASTSPSSSSPPPTPVFQCTSPTSPRLSDPPETVYLDSARLAVLSADAADVTAIYMFLLLYRQLVHSESSDSPISPQDPAKIGSVDLLRLKTEIRDIGSARLGYCFFSRLGSDEAEGPREKDVEKERTAKQDIVLQVAKRAEEARSPSAPPSPVSKAPSETMVQVAQRWADSNIHPDSSLCTMLRRRLRDVVFNSVVAQAYPGRDSIPGKLTSIDFLSCIQNGSTQAPSNLITGMEPLAEEIRALAEKISRLALIHLNAYLPLYEQEGFIV